MGDFDVTKEGTVGVDGATMDVAIGNLDDLKTQFTNWNTQLVELRDLVIADWFGGAADQFQGSYEELAQVMYQMIDCAMKLRDFSQSTVDGYDVGDQAMEDMVYSALGRL